MPLVVPAGGHDARATLPHAWMTPSRRRQAELWWPIAARVVGVVIGIEQTIAAALGGKVDAGLMTFAAGLILAPNIAGTQQRRNSRDEDE
jgi:hypothetical protein